MLLQIWKILPTEFNIHAAVYSTYFNETTLIEMFNPKKLPWMVAIQEIWNVYQIKDYPSTSYIENKHFSRSVQIRNLENSCIDNTKIMFQQWTDETHLPQKLFKKIKNDKRMPHWSIQEYCYNNYIEAQYSSLNQHSKFQVRINY